MRSTICIQTQTSRDADDTNVNRMRDLSMNRRHHLHQLETIYKQRNQIKAKSEKSQLKRNHELDQYYKNKQANINYKNKKKQDRINYENAILRNKLLEVMHDRKKGYSYTIERRNPYKIRREEETYQANLKLGERLSNIRSEVMAKNNLQDHYRRTQMYGQIVQKKSPKKRAYLKSLMKRGPAQKFINSIDDDLHTFF